MIYSFHFCSIIKLCLPSLLIFVFIVSHIYKLSIFVYLFLFSSSLSPFIFYKTQWIRNDKTLKTPLILKKLFYFSFFRCKTKNKSKVKKKILFNDIGDQLNARCYN